MQFSNFPVLQTQRLTLRRFENKDFSAYFSLHQDSSVYPFITDKGPLGESSIRQKIQRNRDTYLEGNHLYWVAALTISNQFLGYIAAHDISDSAILSYAVLTEHQRRGFMTEALQEVIRFLFSQGLSAIEARTHLENTASTALLISMGFERMQDDNARMVFRLSAPKR